ncbi:hypothetical protein ACLESO_20300 [Pyxidicoccus sp. 3LG]
MREGRYRALCLAVVLTGGAVAHAAEKSCSYPRLPYPTPLSPAMPYDVNYKEKKSLEDRKQFADVQRLFDILSWQTFIALNWPVGPGGQPRAKLTDSGPRLWEGWKESFEVYREDGRRPAPWGSSELKKAAGAKAGERLLLMTQKVGHRGTVVDETLQAFSGPLIDQNGRWVRYEVLMNQEEFDYVVDSTFYNLEGQFAFTQSGGKVGFPAGDSSTKKRGAMELKLSWKELDPKKDIRDRFLRITALIPKNPSEPTKGYERREMGLVGMHIAIKTKSSPTWIWSTFEHVDNVEVNPLAQVKNNEGKLVSLSPLFNNPNAPAAAVNVRPAVWKTTTDACGNTVQQWDPADRTPVQVTRTIPIPADKQLLNCEVQALLAGTALQYYELVDTQWPTDPSAPAIPGGPGTAPGSVVHKAPGNITPVFLTNTTMETYFQRGNQTAGQQEEGGPTDDQVVFATESCTGCHYSAGIVTDYTINAKTGQKCATFGGAGNGDFSWLMAQKAQWRNPIAQPPRHASGKEE